MKHEREKKNYFVKCFVTTRDNNYKFFIEFSEFLLLLKNKKRIF